MLPDDRERLVRVETKLDMALEGLKMVGDHERDISFVKRSLKGIWALILLVATFLGTKH